MMPVDAASRTPITVTVIANPPRTGPSRRANPLSRPRAMPERSSSTPMKMNMGNATITQFSMTSQMRSTLIDV